MIKIEMQSYNIIIENNGLSKLSSHIKEVYDYNKLFIITDQIVYDLYCEKITTALDDYDLCFVVVKPGEKAKTLFNYENVIKQLLKNKIRRNHLIIAFGGGVIGDLAGYIAATLYRGVSYVQVPTTLLAQIDSSIGGKVGLNLNEGKNLIGAFYNPKLVLVDPWLLKTLSKREFNNGCAEMIKAGLIGDKSLYNQLLLNNQIDIEQIIKSIRVKQTLVTQDPFDHNKRMHLNFGHTFGHAIEHTHLYKHGKAISYGMLIALKLGIKLGESTPKMYYELKELLLKKELVEEPLLEAKDYLDAITYDKKMVNEVLNYIIVPKVGTAKIVKLKRSDFK